MPKLTIKKDLTNRVDAGIAFLNVAKPGWEKKIDLDEFDLQNPWTCVLGEVYGNYFDGREKIGMDENDTAPTYLGFCLGKGRKKQYSLLTKIWKEKVENLRKR